MRTMKAVLLVTALIMSASAAHASNLTFGLQGGVTVPMSDFSDFVKLGPQGGVFGDWWVKDELALGADIVGNFHNGNEDLIKELKSAGFTDPEIKFTAIQFGVHGKSAPKMVGAPAQPWVSVGAGVYNGKTTFNDSFSGVPFDSDDTSSKIDV